MHCVLVLNHIFSLFPNLLYEKLSNIFDYLTHFHLWQKSAKLNQFSENYHPGSKLGLSLGHVNYQYLLIITIKRNSSFKIRVG